MDDAIDAGEAAMEGQGASRSDMHPRYEQTFPTLTLQEIDRLRQFGENRRYSDGEALFETGRPSPGMIVVLSGHVSVTQRDGLGHVSPVVEQGEGQFLAEIAALSERPALVDGHAEGDVEALLIRRNGLQQMFVAEADLGERIMRALILRRVALIQSEAGGPVLIGDPDSADVVRLQGFLTRNGHPHHVLDPAVDADAADLVARYSPAANELPLVVAPDGSVLRNPAEEAMAERLGMVDEADRSRLFDVAVVGAGPGGLATAVYAASEGLSVAVLDCRAFGGQAGASARIENYLGFPTGISGQALAGRAYNQALKFGVEMMIPAQVTALDCKRENGALRLLFEHGEPVRARTVIIASGATYRRPAIDNLETFEGRGVWYWASPIEARLCAGEEVVLVGGGNSAGQAAVFLASHAAKVRMIVRAPELAASMSSYLVERISAASNVELMTETEIVALEGTRESGLTRVRWRNRATGAEDAADIRNVFLFVGADPATAWLSDCGVETDKAGFVITGAPVSEGSGPAVPPLQSSVPGVFAVGDVRSGSVKRVGGAIGEGAQVVPAVHAFLAGTADKT